MAIWQPWIGFGQLDDFLLKSEEATLDPRELQTCLTVARLESFFDEIDSAVCLQVQLSTPRSRYKASIQTFLKPQTDKLPSSPLRG